MTEQTTEQFPCPPTPRTEVERLAAQVAELQGLLEQAEHAEARAIRERNIMRERVSEPYGCRYCGEKQRHHGRRYIASVGMHSWEKPDDAQVMARMLARRAAQMPLLTEGPERGKLWSLLDWSFWGAGMGDVFRMPLADAMLAAVPAETIAQAEQIMAEFIERRQIEKTGVTVWQEQRDELAQLRARVAELEAERAKYVGAEPTIAEEMAYLSRCFFAVHQLCDEAEQQASRWEQPLPVPEWVAEVRAAASGERPEDPTDNRRRIYLDAKGNAWISVSHEDGTEWVVPVQPAAFVEQDVRDVADETGGLREIGRCW